jgi:hypothetical protein
MDARPTHFVGNRLRSAGGIMAVLVASWEGGGFRLFTTSTAADVVLDGCSQPFVIAFGDDAWIPW